MKYSRVPGSDNCSYEIKWHSKDCEHVLYQFRDVQNCYNTEWGVSIIHSYAHLLFCYILLLEFYMYILILLLS